jgi:hypothetical protein
MEYSDIDAEDAHDEIEERTMRKIGVVVGVVLGVFAVGAVVSFAMSALRPEAAPPQVTDTAAPEASFTPAPDAAALSGGATFTPTPLPTRDEPGIDAKNISIRLVNGLESDVCWLYIRPNTQAQWGDDRLGSSTILSPGDSIVFDDQVPGLYDIRADDCVNRELWFIRGMALRTDQTVVIGAGSTTATPSPTPEGTLTPTVSTGVTFVNALAVNVCFLYISPSTSDSWGDDVLGVSRVLAAGQRVTIEDVQTGVYDLRADDCDNGELWREMGIPLNGNETITISD